MTLQDHIRELLKGKGMTIAALSQKSGVPKATIYRLLRGQPIGTDKLQAIADATDTNVRLVQK